MRLKKLNGAACQIAKLCLCATIPLIAAPSLAYSASPPRTMSYTESDVVRNVDYVAMADGARQAYISYHPKSGRYPTIFIYGPYSESAMTFERAKPFLDAGYAVVGANWRATGCSEGVIETNFPTRVQGKDGAEIVEWIAKQSWSDGNVGMVGNSYPGMSQILVAAQRPRHLRAIVPAGVSDAYDTAEYLGGMLQPSIKEYEYRWIYELQPPGMKWRISHGDTECTKIHGGARVKKGYYEATLEHPLRDQWWTELESTRSVDTINIPTMIVAAFQDEYGGEARESARIFSRLPSNLKSKRLFFVNGPHASGSTYPFIFSEQLKFLDRWVKGVRNGVENELPVKVFWEVGAPDGDPTKAVPGWTTTHQTWPDPAVQRRTFYLTVDGAMSPERGSSSQNAVRSYLYPTGAELTGSNKQFALLPHKAGVLNYRTGPMGSDTTLLGTPQVTLYLSIDNGDDADVALTLKDIDPDGKVTFLQSGLQRASFPEIDEKQTSAEEVVHTFSKAEKLIPGKVYEVRMSFLAPIAHVVRKGHSLELTVAAPNPIPHLGPHLGASPGIGSIPAGSVSANQVYHTSEYPSRVVFPILPGVISQAPTPECGTLLGQPCREQADFILGGLSRP